MVDKIRELKVDELENVGAGSGGHSGDSNGSGTSDSPVPKDLKSIVWGGHH